MSYESAKYDYENFMDKMTDFYFEMSRLNNKVKKPFIGLLTLFDSDRMSDEERSRFDHWEKEKCQEFTDIVTKNGLYVEGCCDDWEILPFDPDVLPYSYYLDFDVQIEAVTEHTHGVSFGRAANPLEFNDYLKEVELDFNDISKIFQHGVRKLDDIWYEGLGNVNELCNELRGPFSSTKLMKECEKYVFR
jgi:hypothetical protein